MAKFLVLAPVDAYDADREPAEFFRFNDLIEAETIEDARALCEKSSNPAAPREGPRFFLVPALEIRR